MLDNKQLWRSITKKSYVSADPKLINKQSDMKTENINIPELNIATY